MKCLSIILLFVFLLGCTTSAQEKENPLEGTTWESVSSKFTRGDGEVFTRPESKYDRAIIIYGKTHVALVRQDTSRGSSESVASTYIITGDSVTYTLIMHRSYEDIGRSFTSKFQIEGDQMISDTPRVYVAGYEWKMHGVWKKID